MTTKKLTASELLDIKLRKVFQIEYGQNIRKSQWREIKRLMKDQGMLVTEDNVVSFARTKVEAVTRKFTKPSFYTALKTGDVQYMVGADLIMGCRKISSATDRSIKRWFNDCTGRCKINDIYSQEECIAVLDKALAYVPPGNILMKKVKYAASK